MEDEESEFSFKDLFFYCIKKWFIIVIAAVVGVGIGLVTTLLKSQDEESYRVSAVFCSLDVFKTNNPQMQTDGTIIILESDYPALYNSATEQFRRIMTESERMAAFVETDSFKLNAEKAFPGSSIATAKDRQVLFSKNFEVVASGIAFNIGIKGEFDTDEKRTAAKALIRDYTEQAREAVYKVNTALRDYKNINGDPTDAITVSEPIYFLSNNDLEKGGGLMKNALMGLVIGLVAGIIVTVIIYIADPRIKSVSAIGVGGELIAKVKEDELKREAVLRVAGKTKDDKMLLIASPEYDGFTEALSKAVAHEFAAAGLNTLYVDFSGGADGGEISEFFAGKDIKDVVTTSDGYDGIGSKSRANVTALMSKKEKFASLKDVYDKIVVAYSDSSDGGAVALGDVSDKILYVINQKSTKLKNLQALAIDVNKRESELGTYIHNSI